MATASVSSQRTGIIALTTTIADNSITIQGGGPVALYVYLDDATNDGTFSYPASDTGAVKLQKQQWTEVWRREGRGGDGPCTIYFAAGAGTPNLQFRVTS